MAAQASLEAVGSSCVPWLVRMEPPLAGTTVYRLSLNGSRPWSQTYALDSDRTALRRALKSLHVDGATYAAGKERSWQQRERITKGTAAPFSLRLEQQLGGEGIAVWHARDPQYMPCSTAPRLQVEVSCEGESTVLVAEEVLSTSTWSDAFSTSPFSPYLKHQASEVEFGGVEVPGIVELHGLALEGHSITVRLWSTLQRAEVSFSVPGNAATNPAIHNVAVHVWKRLMSAFPADCAVLI